MIPFIAAVVLLVGAPRAERPAPESGSRVLVTVTPADSTDTGAVQAEAIAAAIRLRAGDAKIQVTTAALPGEPPWRVEVTPFAAGVVDVLVQAPSGRQVRAGTLSQRDPKLVSDTIALWVVEALTPVMAELSRQVPVIPPPPSGFAPPPQKQTEEGLLRFALRVGAGWHRLSPSGRTLGVFGVEGELGLGSHFAIVPGLDVSTKLATSGPTYAISGHRFAGTLALAGLWRFSPVVVFVHAGPMVRMLRFTARGDDVALADRTFTDGGLEATLGLTTNRLTELFDVGVSARVETYFAKPDFAVDGVEVLDSGAGALTLGLWLQHAF